MRTPRDPIYAGHRYPAEIISYAVWLYFRFPLSLRMVEELLAARGIWVTPETTGKGGLKFGREFANRIRRRAPRRGDKWHLDEVGVSFVPSTRTASFLMFSSRAGATRRPPNACSASSPRSRVEPLVCSSPTSLRATPLPSGRSCPGSSIGSTRASITGPKTPINRPDDE